MEFEFYWADYKRFGSDGSLITLSRIMENNLKSEYGPAINRIFMCGHCRALTLPNDNLSKIFHQFEEERDKLQKAPSIRFLKKKQELEIRFATVWPVAEELRPDAEMIKLGTFQRFYKKVLVLLEKASQKHGNKIDFNFAQLSSDIRELEISLPKSLKELALLYAEYQK
ncbi:MAG: hypothetical protein K8R45_15155 [Desulfobacterales bacterium]|nr:hypothetical protein [Desulfobacterales bacterium]